MWLFVLRLVQFEVYLPAALGTLLARGMSDLQRVQLAHEGMRMLLCSELKQAEELFRTSR